MWKSTNTRFIGLVVTAVLGLAACGAATTISRHPQPKSGSLRKTRGPVPGPPGASNHPTADRLACRFPADDPPERNHREHQE